MIIRFTKALNDHYELLALGLNPLHFVVLFTISRHTIGWHKDSCCLTNAEIARLSNISLTTTKQALKELERLGLITIEYVTPNVKSISLVITEDLAKVVATRLLGGRHATTLPPPSSSEEIPSVIIGSKKRGKETSSEECAALRRKEVELWIFQDRKIQISSSDRAQLLEDFPECEISVTLERLNWSLQNLGVKAYRKKYDPHTQYTPTQHIAYLTRDRIAKAQRENSNMTQEPQTQLEELNSNIQSANEKYFKKFMRVYERKLTNRGYSVTQGTNSTCTYLEIAYGRQTRMWTTTQPNAKDLIECWLQEANLQTLEDYAHV